MHHYDRTYYYILDIILASVFQPRDYILRHPGVDLFQILNFHRHATGSERIYFQWEVTLAQKYFRLQENRPKSREKHLFITIISIYTYSVFLR